MQTLELQNRVVEGRLTPLDRPALADAREAKVEGIMRGLVRHRAKRSDTHPAMAVDELVQLRRSLLRIACVNGGVLGAGLMPSGAGASTRPMPLRFATLSGMDVGHANHYLRRTA